MNALVLDIMEEAGTLECVIAAELPRRTGLHIDPNERFDSRATVKRLESLSDERISARRDALVELGNGIAPDRPQELYEYSILVARQMNKRRLK